MEQRDEWASRLPAGAERKRHDAGPAGWRFIGGLTYERCPAGVVQSWQISLETAGSTKPILIRKSAIAPPPAVRQPTESLNDGETNVSLASMIDRFNLTLSEIERKSPLPHQLPPLTLDETLAAVVLSQADTEDSGLARDRPEQLQKVLATHQLPSQARFELVSSTENAIGQIFAIDSIRLVIPTENGTGPSDVVTVRHRFIELDRDHPAATRWSRPGRNGLQAGVRLLPAQRTYRHGQVVDVEILYRNVTSQPVPATLPRTFQFSKVSGIRLDRVSFVRPRWPDGSIHTLIEKEPVVVRGHRMQICFDSSDALKPEVNLKAMTRPEAAHYVRFVVQNPGDDANEETLEIRERLYFDIASQSPPKVLPLYDSHYFQHWGTSVPEHRRPEHSTPDPDYIDPFQMGVSLGPANKSSIPAYYAGGLQVTKVAPYSPAQAAGIEVGDILLSWESNQIDGDDPIQPFLKSTRANNQLREALDKYAKSKGWTSFNMNFDLLDHRTGQVLRISPWFGAAAGGGPNKAEIIQRMTKRQTEREQSRLEP